VAVPFLLPLQLARARAPMASRLIVGENFIELNGFWSKR
jgi:hypothetical protein